LPAIWRLAGRYFEPYNVDGSNDVGRHDDDDQYSEGYDHNDNQLSPNS
jgi:hypothetical protein